MRIGLLSDSHGKTAKLQTALGVLMTHDVDAIVHCGDICSLKCLQLLTSAGVPGWLVAGNMDRHLHHQLEASAHGTAITFWFSTVEVPIENDAYLVATHGDNEDLLDELIRGQHFPYVCHGHTHRASDRRIGNARVICPGAIAGPRHPLAATVAVLDTVTDDLAFYDIAQPDTPITV